MAGTRDDNLIGTAFPNAVVGQTYTIGGRQVVYGGTDKASTSGTQAPSSTGITQVSAEAVAHCKNMVFDFSGTLRNQKVNLNDYKSYNFIIDVNGNVYQGANANENQASIVIIGGIDKFMYAKTTTLASNFFLTEQQKVTLYKIIRELSVYTNTASITSDNELLEQALSSLYNNYCG